MRLWQMKQGQTVIASVDLYAASEQWRQWSHDGVSETRQYNNLSQLTRMTAVGSGQTLVDMEYRYPGSQQNNGRIASAKDWVRGEDVAYQYDDLQRMISAVATGAAATTTAWGRGRRATIRWAGR